MTLAELRTALQARGFNHLSTTEQERFLNWAYTVDICEAENWPFLSTSTTGTAPVTISDLRTIESVRNTTQKQRIVPLIRSQVIDYDTDLTTSGTAFSYYLSDGTTLATYPANTTDTLSVTYWKVPETLSADGDTPILPSRFHPLIVDGAVRRAYETSDEWDAAEAARQVFEGRLQQMRESLMHMQHDAPNQYVSVNNATDA